MSDYFDQFEVDFAHATARQAHRRWYRRALAMHARRSASIVIACLVVATPAVGAVTNWFGFGAPDRLPTPVATQGTGAPLPGASRLLSLRVSDPQGGPRWGMRVVRTTRSDVCAQVGRVEDGRLGSLGIDGAWKNDKKFHPFPSSSVGDECGTTDAVGNGFLNQVDTGVVANANPDISTIRSCQSPRYTFHAGGSGQLLPPTGHTPECPPGSTRIIASGLLGPDATAITYQSPGGQLTTEPTTGRDGAYLLVFPVTARTCDLYTHDANGGYGPCGSTVSIGGVSPNAPGPVRAVRYRDGHVCHVRASYPRGCPAVGYVAAKQKLVTQQQVTTPLTIRVYRASRWCFTKKNRQNAFNQIPCDTTVPAGYERVDMTQGHVRDPGVLVDVSFKAPVAVISSSEFYDFQVKNPHNGGGSGGPNDLGNITAGETLRYQAFADYIDPGVYEGVIRFVQDTGATSTGEGSGLSALGHRDAPVVGRFSFRVP